MSQRYLVSKILDVFGTRAIAERSTQPVIINTVNPGLCYSELSREMQGWAVALFMRLLARTTEVGSRTLVAAVFAGKESHGQYMSDCVVKAPSPFVRSEEGKKTQERVWKELSAKLEEIQPGILANL